MLGSNHFALEEVRQLTSITLTTGASLEFAESTNLTLGIQVNDFLVAFVDLNSLADDHGVCALAHIAFKEKYILFR